MNDNYTLKLTCFMFKTKFRIKISNNKERVKLINEKKKTDETIKAKIPIVFIHSSRYQLTIEINKKLQMK